MEYVEDALEILHENYLYYLQREYKNFLVNIKLYKLNSKLGQILFESRGDEVFIDFGSEESNLTFSDFFKLLDDYESEESPYIISSENTLKNIVSIIEDYLKEILTYLFTKYPERIFSKKGQINLNQLLKYDNIEDLKEKVINDKVVSVSYSSITDTIHYIEKEFNVDFEINPIIIDGLVEIFSIRNILVHNKGIINEIFLDKVGNKQQQMAEESYELGSKIIINPEGVSDTIDTFVFLGNRINESLIQKFKNNNVE